MCIGWWEWDDIAGTQWANESTMVVLLFGLRWFSGWRDDTLLCRKSPWIGGGEHTLHRILELGGDKAMYVYIYIYDSSTLTGKDEEAHSCLFTCLMLHLEVFLVNHQCHPRNRHDWQGKPYHQKHLDLLEQTLLLCTSRCSTAARAHVFSLFIHFWLPFQQMMFDCGTWESFKVEERSRKKHRTMRRNKKINNS